MAPKGSCGSVRLVDALEFACEGDEGDFEGEGPGVGEEVGEEGEAFAEGAGAPRASEPPGLVVRRERAGNVFTVSLSMEESLYGIGHCVP